MRILIAAIIIMASTTAFAQEVKYIDAPKFDGEMYLYGQLSSEDASYEQWYEI